VNVAAEGFLVKMDDGNEEHDTGEEELPISTDWITR